MSTPQQYLAARAGILTGNQTTDAAPSAPAALRAGSLTAAPRVRALQRYTLRADWPARDHRFRSARVPELRTASCVGRRPRVQFNPGMSGLDADQVVRAALVDAGRTLTRLPGRQVTSGLHELKEFAPALSDSLERTEVSHARVRLNHTTEIATGVDPPAKSTLLCSARTPQWTSLRN